MAVVKHIHIIGAGGHANVVLDIVEELRKYVGINIYADSYDPVANNRFWDYPIKGSATDFFSEVKYNWNHDYIVAIGDNSARGRLSESFKLATKRKPVTLIHPKAIVSDRAKIGHGTVIMAGAVVGPGAVIGDNCIINHGATVDHDCMLEDAVHICPGAHIAGAVKVGKGVQVGIGASVIQGISIGEYTTIGAGAAVVSDIAGWVTAVGVPAKVIKEY
jgi:acetyltransferase EpsM